MNCYIAIPTYKRSDSQPTLDYLEKIGVPKNLIIMSVQTEEDLIAYREKGYAKRVSELLFRPGHNLSDNRNTILDNLPQGARVVILDDDIRNIGRLVGDGLKPLETANEFFHLLHDGFSVATKHHSIGFSVYPVYNAYFMSKGYTARSIGEGTFLALTNVGMRFSPAFDTKEDYEFSCRVIRRFGTFPRLNNFACNAPHYTTKGGCKENWDDKKKVMNTARRLVGMYPEILKLNSRRPGEVKMVKEKKQP